MGRMNGLGKRKGRSDGQANPAAAYGSKERRADEPASLRILIFLKAKGEGKLQSKEVAVGKDAAMQDSRMRVLVGE